MSKYTLRRIYRRWLPLVLVLAALANSVANEQLTATSQTYRRHASGSLTHLVHTEQRSVDLRYGIYMELGDALVGGTLVLPEESALDPHLARGLSGVEVIRLGYDPSHVPDQVMPEGQALGSLRAEGENLPYWVLPGEGVDRWWLGQTPDGIVIVPETVSPVPEPAR